MNLFRKAMDFFNPSKNKLLKQLYELSIFSGNINYMEDNPDSYLKDGYGNIDVYSIVTRINNMRKQARLRLMRRLPDGTTEEVTKDHELLKFKDNVNPTMSTDDFSDSFVIFRSIIGEHFTYKIAPTSGINKGKVIEFFAMPGNDVEIIEGTWMQPIKGYKLENTLGTQLFEPNEVVHSKIFNPYFGDGSMHGLSPLRAARMTLEKQNEALSTQTKQFNNQGPAWVMFRDNSNAGNNGIQNRMTETQQKDAIKQMERHTKRKGSKLPLVLKDKYGVLNLGSTVADLDIIESTKDGLIKFCNMLSMPPELFGLEATYNNQNEARKAAWTDSIIPTNKAFTNHMNAITINGVAGYEDLFWSYDYSKVEELQLGMKTKVEWMRNAHWSVNAILEATGQPKSNNPLMDEPQFQSGTTFASEVAPIEDEDTKKDYEDYL